MNMDVHVDAELAMCNIGRGYHCSLWDVIIYKRINIIINEEAGSVCQASS